MPIDATCWEGPWWRAVRRVNKIPDAVRDQSAAEIVVQRLALSINRNASRAEWVESMTSAENALEALVLLGSQGTLDGPLCGQGRITYPKDSQMSSDPREDAIQAIEAGRSIPHKIIIGPLWDEVSQEVLSYEDPPRCLCQPT
jgi:hypothetical protein